jgi:MoxR-like ATPase
MYSDIERALTSINNIIIGKSKQVKLAVSCLLAGGHLLIEDVPGVGKTTLSHTLAKTLGLDFNRIQFTSDMLPADILGVAIFDRDNHQFSLHKGPIFTQMILADEINRATPRTQSALLEAMEEHQVTIENETYDLPQPFFIIATQNPSNQLGTYPLPESQLDRFLMRIELGYPDAKSERALLLGQDRKQLLNDLDACMSLEQLKALQHEVSLVHVSEALVDYIQKILSYSRESNQFEYGLSPRAGIALLHAAQAWAFLEQHNHVLPEDVQAVLPYVITHRLQPRDQQMTADIISDLISAIAIP